MASISLVLSILAWPEARIGVFVNTGLLALLLGVKAAGKVSL